MLLLTRTAQKRKTSSTLTLTDRDDEQWQWAGNGDEGLQCVGEREDEESSWTTRTRETYQ